jgi:hypothetical protein
VYEHSAVIRQVVMSDEAHLNCLVVWINKTGVELIWMNCMWNHFTVTEEQCGLAY